MAEKTPNRIDGGLFEQDSNSRRFHLGAHPQAGIPADLTEEEEAALDLHRHQIKAPQNRPRFREAVPKQGLVIDDASTGSVKPLETDKRGKVVEPTKAEQKAAAKAAEDEARAEMGREPKAK